MQKPENSFGKFESGELGEIARNLVVAVSNAVAEAAGDARRTLRSSESRAEANDLVSQILASLEPKPISLVTLRKRISDAAAGVKPNQLEFTNELEKLVATNLVSETKTKDRTLYALTPEGEAKKFSLQTQDQSQGKERDCDGVSLMKAAGRVSTLLVEVSSNGTKAQKEHVAKELEELRIRIIAILADNKLG